jgi:hypothetical protein
MSFSYTHLDNPTGTGPFTFVPTYSDTAEIVVQGYNGKYWSTLAISSVDAQTVTLAEDASGLNAIRISNNKAKVDSAFTNGSDGNMLRSGDTFNEDLEIRLSDPTDRTGSSPLTPEGVTIGGLFGGVSESVQGYYGMLSSFYFGGGATETEITIAEVNTWVDVELTVDAAGLFDNRPSAMKTAQTVGHSGDGSTASPVVFNLEGLDIQAFANFRASLSFEPAEDEGQFESRLLFNRHSGTTPITDFSIEEVSLSMQNGADIDYVSEPMLSFFIGDTIDTNGAGDAGKCRFQIKSNVEGTLKLRALTWYINK